MPSSQATIRARKTGPASLRSSRLHGVDPQAYLTAVLTKLVNLWPASRLDEFMPWTWAAECSTNKLAT